VSVAAGGMVVGFGRSISLPNDVLHAASDEAGRNAETLVLALECQGLSLREVQGVALAIFAGLAIGGSG